jgi:hypothetical protein
MSRQPDLIAVSPDGTTEYVNIDFGRAIPGTPTTPVECIVFNTHLTDDTGAVRINAGRSDMRIAGPSGELAADAMESGDGLVSGAMVEASPDGITWTPIDESGNYLSLPAIAHQDSAALFLRLNIPGASTIFGAVFFNLIVRC